MTLLEQIMDIKTLVEQQVCKGEKHSEICQKLTQLYYDVQKIDRIRTFDKEV